MQLLLTICIEFYSLQNTFTYQMVLGTTLVIFFYFSHFTKAEMDAYKVLNYLLTIA